MVARPRHLLGSGTGHYGQLLVKLERRNAALGAVAVGDAENFVYIAAVFLAVSLCGGQQLGVGSSVAEAVAFDQVRSLARLLFAAVGEHLIDERYIFIHYNAVFYFPLVFDLGALDLGGLSRLGGLCDAPCSSRHTFGRCRCRRGSLGESSGLLRGSLLSRGRGFGGGHCGGIGTHAPLQSA